MKHKIGKRLKEANGLLQTLGPERSFTTEQASYVADLATGHSQLAMLPLQVKVGSDGLFDDFSALRIAPSVIAPSVMVRAMVFEVDMAHYGHTYLFSGGTVKKASMKETGVATLDRPLFTSGVSTAE